MLSSYQSQFIQLSISESGIEQNLYSIWSDHKGKLLKIGKSWVKVLHPGYLNLSAGPDFKNAQILLPGGRILSGDIEIHWHSSNWKKHNHSGNPEYKNVILHVACTGDDKSVQINEIRTAPTVLFSNIKPKFNDQFCIDLTRDLSEDNIIATVRLFSNDRWNDLQKKFINSQHHTVPESLFRLIDTRGNAHNIDSLTGEFILFIEKKYSIVDIVDKLEKKGLNLRWIMGKKRPKSHARFRIPILAYLASLWCLNTEKFINYTLRNAFQDLKVFSEMGYPVPGKLFISEIFGNVIFPVQESYLFNSKFNEWYSLPVQKYNITKKRLKCWNLNYPVTFGFQQGVIKLEKELCQLMGCGHCPLLIQSTNHCLA